MASWGVNALACTPARVVAPAHEPRPWTTYLGVPALAPSARESLASEPVRVWSLGTGRGAAGPPAVGDSVIVVQTTEPRLVAIARTSGRKLWSARVDGLGSAGALLDGDRVYTATARGGVYAFALPTGRRTWGREMAPAVGPLALAGDRVFAASASGSVYALNRKTGIVAWRRELEAVLHAGPTVARGYLLLASDDSLFLLRMDDGSRERAAGAKGVGLSPPAVADSLLVFSSPNGFVAGFHATRLDELWRVDVREAVFGSAVVARDTAFAVTIGGSLWRIPLAAPERAGAVPLGVAVRAAPTPIRDGVLIATIAGEILRVSADGSVRWRVRVDGPIEQPPIVDRGLLVFVDGRGRIHAWK